MVVLRIWWGALFVTSPICRAQRGSIDGRGRLFGRVTWAAFVPFASCRAGAGSMSHRIRSEVAPRRTAPEPLRAVDVLQAKIVDKSCDRHPLHGRKTLSYSKKLVFRSLTGRKSASLQKNS